MLNHYRGNPTNEFRRQGLQLLWLVISWLMLLGFSQSVPAQSGTRSSSSFSVPARPDYVPDGSSRGFARRSAETRGNAGAAYYERPQSGGLDQLDHRAWDALLQKYVDPHGNVDYAAWQSNRADREQLRGYLRQLSQVDRAASSTVAGDMAFWINTYNALTIEGILQVFPTTSIKNYAPDASGFNIRDDFKIAVAGREYSLNDIEHKVLRPMGDPRIHFAIVCASRGCPQLSRRAYFPQHLDQQLTDSARRFFADPSKFRYDVQRSTLSVSPIIRWFSEDFGRTDAERYRYLAQFLPDPSAVRWVESGRARVNYLDYDWNLNVAPTAVNCPRPATYSQPPTPDTHNCQAGVCSPCHGGQCDEGGHGCGP